MSPAGGRSKNRLMDESDDGDEDGGHDQKLSHQLKENTSSGSREEAKESKASG